MKSFSVSRTLSKQRNKGLKRALSFQQHFKKAVDHVQGWNNTPLETAKIFKIVALCLVGLHNVKTSDFQSDLTEFTPQSSKLYIRILLTVYVEGKAARTKTLLTTGIGTNKMYLIDELVKHGYLEEVITKRLQLTFNNNARNIDQKEIELTTKGYDFLMMVFKLIINEDLL